MKIYIYNESNATLTDTLEISDIQSIKAILYNLSDKNNGSMITFKDVSNLPIKEIQKMSNGIKWHSRHIYQNNGNFIKNYA